MVFNKIKIMNKFKIAILGIILIAEGIFLYRTWHIISALNIQELTVAFFIFIWLLILLLIFEND